MSGISIAGARWGSKAAAQFSYAGNPNGHVLAHAAGDLCVDYATPALYQATAPGTTHWTKVGGGGGGGALAVSYVAQFLYGDYRIETGAGVATQTKLRLYFAPFTHLGAFPLSGVGIRCETATITWRLGVYEDATGQPTTKIVTAPLKTVSSGPNIASMIATLSSGGRHWLAVARQGTTGTISRVATSNLSVTPPLAWRPVAGSVAPGRFYGWRSTAPIGAGPLPASAPALTLISLVTQTPWLVARAA